MKTNDAIRTALDKREQKVNRALKTTLESLALLNTEKQHIQEHRALLDTQESARQNAKAAQSDAPVLDLVSAGDAA